MPLWRVAAASCQHWRRKAPRQMPTCMCCCAHVTGGKTVCRPGCSGVVCDVLLLGCWQGAASDHCQLVLTCTVKQKFAVIPCVRVCELLQDAADWIIK